MYGGWDNDDDDAPEEVEGTKTHFADRRPSLSRRCCCVILNTMFWLIAYRLSWMAEDVSDRASALLLCGCDR